MITTIVISLSLTVVMELSFLNKKIWNEQEATILTDKPEEGEANPSN